MEIERAVRGNRNTIKTVTYRGQVIDRLNFNAERFVRSVIRARRSIAPPRTLREFLDNYDDERR